jgi:hypothetical protein
MATLLVFLVGGIFAGGIVCIAIAVRSGRRTRRRRTVGGIAEGTVVALVPQPSDGGPSYVTVVEFLDRQSRRHRVSSSYATAPAPHAVGGRVPVSYEPGDPDDAHIVPETRSLVALGLVGALLALVAILLWWDIWIGAMSLPATTG